MRNDVTPGGDDDSGESDVSGFFEVAKMLPERQDVVTVEPDDAVREAIALMQKHGFDQLPVVAGGIAVGVFSYRSLANGLAHVRRQDDPLTYPVGDFVEDISYVRASEEVGEVLNVLDRHGVVLVGHERDLIAVATSTDVVSFLWETTRPFVLLQDIELACRHLMLVACPDVVELGACIRDGVQRELESDVADVRDLTMGELLSVLLHKANFGKTFSKTFGRNRDLAASVLEPVRDIRNKVFHFRDDVTVEELETLAVARRWLQRKTMIAGAS